MKKLLISTLCLLMLIGTSGANIVKAEENVVEEGNSDAVVENTSPEVSNETEKENEVSTFAVDVDKPVIEKIEFPDNGKEVEVGTNLPIYVSAYDLGSGIKEVSVNVQYSSSDDKYSDYSTAHLSYNGETKRYEGNVVAKDGGAEKAYISNVKVVDNNSNYANGIVLDASYKNMYTFNIINGTYESIELNSSDLIFPDNQKSFNRNDEITMSITVPEEISKNYDYLDIRFGGATTSHSYSIYKDKDENSNKFSGTFSVGNYIETGKVTLKNIYTRKYNDSGKKVELIYKDKANIWINVNEKNDTEKPVITSIDMDKKGEFVKVGDKVTVRIKATDNIGLEKNASMTFTPVADIQHSYNSISLSYDEKTGEYVGSIEITTDSYPCEWYLSSLSIRDSSDNAAEYRQLLPSEYNGYNPYYFKVNNDGTFVNPTYNLNMEFYALDEKGSYIEVGKWKKDNVERRTTLGEAGIIFPESLSTYKDLVFKGWKDSNGNLIDSKIEVNQSMSNTTRVYAYYDKMLINTTYTYPNSDLTNIVGSYENNHVIVPYGATYKEAIAIASGKNIEDVYKGGEFIGWEVSGYFFNNGENIDSIVKFSPYRSLNLNATYKNKKVVETYRGYFNEDGRRNDKSTVLLVDNGTTYETVYEKMDKSTPNSFKGLRFKEWRSGETNGEIVNDYTTLWVEAVYENCIVRFVLDSMFEESRLRGAGGVADSDFEYIYSMVVEKGETIKIPEIPGYRNIKWMSNVEGDNLKIDESTDFYGWGDKEGEPVKPETPETPEVPETPSKPSTGTTLPNDVIQNVISNIQKAQAGEEIEIIMGEATVVPKDILESVKGKDVNVKLNMGGYTWIINGKDVVSSNLSDINLEVAFDKDAIPSKTVSQLAGDNPVKQLSLTHNGDFGFKAQLSFNIGSDNKDKFGNLYYYDSEGKLVFMNAGKIGEDGNVSLEFSHASDYVIIISDKVMEVSNTDSDIKKDAIKNTGYFTEKDNTMPLSFIALLIVGAGILVVLKSKKSLNLK